MAELKPCPFCGSEAKILKAKANASGTRFAFWVQCTNTELEECVCAPFTRDYETEKGAVEAWNRRAENDT